MTEPNDPQEIVMNENDTNDDDMIENDTIEDEMYEDGTVENDTDENDTDEYESESLSDDRQWIPSYVLFKSISAGIPLTMAYPQIFVMSVEPLYSSWLILLTIAATVISLWKLRRARKRSLTAAEPSSPTWRNRLFGGDRVIAAHLVVMILWLIAIVGPWYGWWPMSIAGILPEWLLWLGVFTGLLTALNCAYLFQAGEDGDRSRRWLQRVIQVFQSLVAGASAAILATFFYYVVLGLLPPQRSIGGPVLPFIFWSFVAMIVGWVGYLVLLLVKSTTRQLSRRSKFWILGVGMVLPLLLAVFCVATGAFNYADWMPQVGWLTLWLITPLISFGGLYAYESALLAEPEAAPSP
jgi:hypothetical protein